MSTSKENPMIILVIVLALVAYGLLTNSSNPVPVVNNNTTTNPNTTTSITNTNTNVGDVNVNTPLETISYGEALVIYKDFSIQFDTACQANPNNVVYRNGTNIMIDNRSPFTRTIKIGSVYTVEPYGFKIIKISSTFWPVKWIVSCDKSQDVATIIIQG
jgi:hypothetical protein